MGYIPANPSTVNFQPRNKMTSGAESFYKKKKWKTSSLNSRDLNVIHEPDTTFIRAKRSIHWHHAQIQQ